MEVTVPPEGFTLIRLGGGWAVLVCDHCHQPRTLSGATPERVDDLARSHACGDHGTRWGHAERDLPSRSAVEAATSRLCIGICAAIRAVEDATGRAQLTPDVHVAIDQLRARLNGLLGPASPGPHPAASAPTVTTIEALRLEAGPVEAVVSA